MLVSGVRSSWAAIEMNSALILLCRSSSLFLARSWASDSASARVRWRTDHTCVGDWFAELVSDAATEDAAARQRDQQLVQRLAVSQFERRARFRGATLPVLE